MVYMDMKTEGDILYYGKGDFDWVGFYSDITNVIMIDDVYCVKTKLGKYELHHAGDIKKMHVKDVSGVSIFELQKGVGYGYRGNQETS